MENGADGAKPAFQHCQRQLMKNQSGSEARDETEQRTRGKALRRV